jgi:hypothetical protein
LTGEGEGEGDLNQKSNCWHSNRKKEGRSKKEIKEEIKEIKERN